MATGEASTTGTTNSAPSPGMSREEIERLVANALGSSQSTEKTQKLLTDNFEYREKLRTVNAEVERLKALVPAEGTLVLTTEQKADWEAYLALGKKPADIAKALKDGEANAVKVADHEREKLLAQVAEAEGFNAKDAATVLQTIVGGREIVLEDVQEADPEDADKKTTVKRAFFKTENADKTVTKTRVRQVVESDHKAFLPALTAASEDEGETASTKSGTSGGKLFPRQEPAASRANGKGGTKNVARSYLNKAYPQPKSE